jgi:hypothetical protein
MEVITKSYLQSLKTDSVIHNAVKQILQGVKATALRETRFVYPLQNRQVFLYGHGQDAVEKCIYYLKQSLPDCIVEFREATDLMGNKTSGIIIDWS